MAKALKELRKHRLSEGSTEAEQVLAGAALEVMAEVMTAPKRHAREQLSAAVAIRTELCGLPVQKTQLGGMSDAPPVSISIDLGGDPPSGKA